MKTNLTSVAQFNTFWTTICLPTVVGETYFAQGSVYRHLFVKHSLDNDLFTEVCLWNIFWTTICLLTCVCVCVCVCACKTYFGIRFVNRHLFVKHIFDNDLFTDICLWNMFWTTICLPTAQLSSAQLSSSNFSSGFLNDLDVRKSEYRNWSLAIISEPSRCLNDP